MLLRFLGFNKCFSSHHTRGERILTVVQQPLPCFSCVLSSILLPWRVFKNECLYSTEQVPLTRAVGPSRVLGLVPRELLAWLPSETC